MTTMSGQNCGLKTTAAKMGGLTWLMVDRSASKRDPLKEDGDYGHIQPTGGRDKKLTQPQLEANHQPWKTGRRVESIFGISRWGQET